ncbi:unnamed protein product [Pleuronectes platessa]|uniref:Uncharacterized protein n=1 Tax=Pleuronectes platessa TaxID=8262 RepID=A0A9N7U6C8_PLEPL|nr:unnamed protein product [Pleuronectes platessa]
MADFLGSLAGNKGIASMVGDQAGEMVEGLVEKVLNKEGSKGTEEEKGGGLDIGNVLSAVGGKKDEDKGAAGIMGAMGSFLK